MENHLKDILKGRVVIVGIGNILRGDDGFGPLLIERLRGNVRAACLDVATSPENFVGRIVDEHPDTVLIVDAVSLGRPAGEFEILEKSDIIQSGFTTHDISPRMFIEYLQNQTKANIYMLGVQPQNISLGDEISAPVKKTLQTIEHALREVIHA